VNDSSNSTPGGAAGTNLGVDAIREFKIVATTFSAEYGRAGGAVLVTGSVITVGEARLLLGRG